MITSSIVLSHFEFSDPTHFSSLVLLLKQLDVDILRPVSPSY